MQRCRTVFLLTLAAGLALILTGCLGSSTSNSNNAQVKSISLSPSGNVSLEVGGRFTFAAVAIDPTNHEIPGANFQYIVSSPPGSNTPPPISITNGGSACAGTWDATQTSCNPGSAGVAIVTAVANGVSSPQATVYVHKHIAQLRISQAQTLPPSYDCFTQGQTWIYQGTAYDGSNPPVDITSTVGQLNWISTNNGVLTTNTNPPLPTPLPLNQVQITSNSPGVTQISAAVSGTTSPSLPITSCLIQQIRLQVSGTTASSVSVTSGSSITLEATAIDSLGNTVAKPPLSWITSNPEVVAFASLTTTTGTNSAIARANAGGSTISAACVPPSCNIGVVPNILIPLLTPPYYELDPSATPAYVFASDGPLTPTNPTLGFGAISVGVTNSPPPTYTAFAATDLCDPDNTGQTNGCTSVMFAVTPTTSNGTNPIGANIFLPRTPNSLVSNHQSRIYIGSDQGLMYSDEGGAANLISSSSTPCYVSLCGKVLAVSNDGTLVVVSDTVSSTPQVYIYNSAAGNAAKVRDLVLPSLATAAAFSPDDSKIFILTNAGPMYVFSIVNALAPVTIPSTGGDVVFSPDGSFAYIAGAAGPAGAVSAFSTCATSTTASTQLGLPVTTSGVPLQIFADPVLQHLPTGNPDMISQTLYAFEPPNIQVLTAQFTQTTNSVPTQPSQYDCNLPVLSFTQGATYSLQQGQFTPVYANLVNNGAEMVIVARYLPYVLIFDISGGTTRSFRLSNPLTDSDDPRAASSSTDGSVVFVAACDQYDNNTPPACLSGSVHIVNTITGNDQYVPYINNTTNNMCIGQGAGAPVCFPDMIVVKPQ